MDLPYKTEYAKSGRSKCKGCKALIDRGSLRLAVKVQSWKHDGKDIQWYHLTCFFDKQRPETVDDVEGFETLKVPDQDNIREIIENLPNIVVPEKEEKGTKRGSQTSNVSALKDFHLEYAGPGRAMCRGCEQKILRDEIRISKKNFRTEVGKKCGGQDMWHHLECFSKLRSELGYFESAAALPGFDTLSAEDKTEALHLIPAVEQDIQPEVKKSKIEDPTEEEKLYKEQMTTFHKNRDQLKELNKIELIEILRNNHQSIPHGIDSILDRLADIMTFGTLERCEECKSGQYEYSKIGYLCHGNLTEWTKCNNVTKTPKRSAFRSPPKIAAKYSFLSEYIYAPRTRIIKGIDPMKKKEEYKVYENPKVEREVPPLYNMEFVILGKPNRGEVELKNQITKLGGKVITAIRETVMAVIAAPADVEKMNARMQKVKRLDIQVVPETFVDEASINKGKIPDLIIKTKICDWGSDPNTRLPPEPSVSAKFKSVYAKSVPSKIKVTLKAGLAVDPSSGLDKKAHVYQERGGEYTVVLTKTDIQKNKNSYYKLQLLQSDRGRQFWVYRAWGRTGTTIGGGKPKEFDSLSLAKSKFYALYEEKTGNMWEDRHAFEKVPGKYYPLDVDYGEEEAKNIDLTDAPSNLDKPVADLIRMIFDLNQMQQTLLQLEVDTEKMPLGKLSENRILEAYEILSELQELTDMEYVQEQRFIDASNRFYTFIPHSFGIDAPPILKTPEIIKQKIEMLDNLMNMEVAYSLIKSTGSDSSLDEYYSTLDTDIKPIDKKSDEFKIIKEYVENTHAETHKNYELEILDVFAVKRQGEEKRFKPFRKLHNRMLLWHGSRNTNFAGILSQGLRIAPPEAPSTGYMFGKGIYFADMVSKSANYCFARPGNNHGLLLLCEVALGDMYELTKAEYIEKLPEGTHSTKGKGKTAPDPRRSKKLGDIEVPLGKPLSVPGIHNGDLLFNEYIVYDAAQVQVKYLLKLDFKFNYY